MSKWKGKLARRIMAIVLSGAMVMSNMSAYAAELVPETSVESVEEVSDAKEQAGAENEENGEDVASGGGASTPEESTPAPEESTPAPEESSEAETSWMRAILKRNLQRMKALQKRNPQKMQKALTKQSIRLILEKRKAKTKAD